METFDVSLWLSDLGLSKFEEKFVDEEITSPRTLSDLTEQNLIDLGLTIGASKKFIRATRKLMQSDSPPLRRSASAYPTSPKTQQQLRQSVSLSTTPLQYRVITFKNGDDKFTLNIEKSSTLEDVIMKVSKHIQADYQNCDIELYSEKTESKITDPTKLSPIDTINIQIKQLNPLVLHKSKTSVNSSDNPDLSSLDWNLVTSRHLNLLKGQGWSSVTHVLSSYRDKETIKAVFGNEVEALAEFNKCVEKYERVAYRRLDEWDSEDIIRWAEENHLFNKDTSLVSIDIIRRNGISGFDLFYQPPVNPKFFMNRCPLITRTARESLRAHFLQTFTPEKANAVDPQDVLKRHQLIEVPFPANVDPDGIFKPPRPEIALENLKRWEYLSNRQGGSPAIGFVGATGSGKSFIINEFLDRCSRLNGDSPPAAEDAKQAIPTTPNMQLYFGQLLDGETLHVIDCEGSGGASPKFVVESPQRFNMLDAIKRLLGADNEDGCRRFEKEADSLRLKVVNEFFPALIYSYCDVLIYVSTNSSSDQKWLDAAVNFADVCAQGTRSNCMPALILIKNQSPWPKNEAERREYLDIEATSNTFISARELNSFGITAEKVGKLKTFYSTIKFIILPIREAYPEDYAIQIHNMKLCIGTLAKSSQLCKTLSEQTRFQLLSALVNQWNNTLPNAQPCLDTAEAYWSIFNQTESKRERAFQVMRLVYYYMRPSPPPEMAWYTKYSSSATANYSKALHDWTKMNAKAYHKAYHVGMVLGAAAQAQELRKASETDVAAGSIFDQTLERTYIEQHKLLAQLRPCQSEYKNLVCIASSFPSHKRHRCYGKIWPDSDTGSLEYTQDPKTLDVDWEGEHSAKWWKKSVLELSKTQTWQKDVAKVLSKINQEMDWKNDSIPFCVVCLETGEDVMLSCGHSACKSCIGSIDSTTCPLCPPDSNRQQVIADDSQRVPKGAGIRILSLDGGGTRGVITQVILTELKKQMWDQHRINLRDMFDFVAGTSLGAMIGAIFSKTGDGLSKLNVRREIIPKVFNNTLAGSILRTLTLMNVPYNSKPIQEFIDNELGKKLMCRSDLRANGPKLAIFTSKKAANNYKPVAFTDFVVPYNPAIDLTFPHAVTIGQAIQASCSSPGYFPSVHIRGEDYYDGGLVANNPCEYAIKLAQSLWPGRSIDCIVSIGTGATEKSKKKPPPLIWLLTALIQGAVNEDVVSKELKQRHQSKYFRLNPELDSQPAVDASDPVVLEKLEKNTQKYLDQNLQKVNLLIRKLIASSFYVSSESFYNDNQTTLKILSRVSSISPVNFNFRLASKSVHFTVNKDEIEIFGNIQRCLNLSIEVSIGGEWLAISGCPIKHDSLKSSGSFNSRHFIPPRWRSLASMLDPRVLSPPHTTSDEVYARLTSQLDVLAQWRHQTKLQSLPDVLSRPEEDRLAQTLFRREFEEDED
eukprot:TRINITY_DN1334_c0_g2_i1.p1 TRINITY_DN1334_c0_g2~~TRINITY_DN1334_c0_g2_i1.p1  ORF type:complete len:1437 (+),score=268.86 TRINITY_DN1334_c0_g2_i1:84-4394(+)